MRKILLILVALIVLVLLFTASAINVQADAPINTSRAEAVYFDNDPHYIPANTSLWYRFDYAGDKTLILTKMFGATNAGLDYAIYAPDQPDKPFARGTAKNMPCSSGGCPEPDFTWKGAVPVGGAYYVEVINSNPQPRTFFLVIIGESVTFGPQPASDTVPTIVQAPSNVSPDSAAPLQNNLVQTIPANTFLWYRFDYQGASPIAVSLADGKRSDVYFRIYTADQAKQVDTSSAYLAQGGAAAADCSGGKCMLGDMSWAGALPGSGTYYVQVYNASPNAMSFRLLLEGEGISLGSSKASPAPPTTTLLSRILEWLEKR